FASASEPAATAQGPRRAAGSRTVTGSSGYLARYLRLRFTLRMNAPSTATRFDIQHLAQSMRHSSALDAVPLNLSDAHWVTLANYMQPVALQQGQVLIEQGVKDRTVYFVESGTLTVHYEDSKERVRIA